MRILVAEDDPDTGLLLEVTLSGWGYTVVAATNGTAAWDILQRADAPRLALLDWMMPGLTGIEICRRVRELPNHHIAPYLLLLTAKSRKEEIVEGLRAGANDYLTKPFDPKELRARVQAGATIIELQRSLAERVSALEAALAEIKQLRGILPICSYCKKIRDDQNYWQQVDGYLSRHTDAKFSHGICPSCYAERVQPELEKRKAERQNAARRDGDTG